MVNSIWNNAKDIIIVEESTENTNNIFKPAITKSVDDFEIAKNTQEKENTDIVRVSESSSYKSLSALLDVPASMLVKAPNSAADTFPKYKERSQTNLSSLKLPSLEELDSSQPTLP